MTHGTNAGYRQGCRCDPCREAQNDYRHAYRARKRTPTYTPTPDTSWMADAACRGMDPELFFPERGEDTRTARQVCFSCSVRSHCLDYALDNKEGYGVWGGLSVRGRETLTGRRMTRGRVS